MDVLVVEDELAIRQVEVAYLQQAGYTVAEASDGATAIDMVTGRTFDAAVIDLNLPGVDGFQVCRTIREKSAMPILIVTARGSDEDEIEGLKIGADDYIKKPFNPAVLVARVEALLRKHGTGAFHCKDLVIDAQAMTVTKNGKTITLTTTLFRLLFALASQPNVVLSRDQLVDAIYNDPVGHFVYDRTIDAHIKTLRKQLGDDPYKPNYIETVIGAGYRFMGQA
ncbi:MAG TPA: response regulator transcription factor [Candidatus Saccharimonadales bacterium]|nr:response regulator transcription factor [Candidatus Saccharimonadales bacterium]